MYTHDLPEEKDYYAGVVDGIIGLHLGKKWDEEDWSVSFEVKEWLASSLKRVRTRDDYVRWICAKKGIAVNE